MRFQLHETKDKKGQNHYRSIFIVCAVETWKRDESTKSHPKVKQELSVGVFPATPFYRVSLRSASAGRTMDFLSTNKGKRNGCTKMIDWCLASAVASSSVTSNDALRIVVRPWMSAILFEKEKTVRKYVTLTCTSPWLRKKNSVMTLIATSLAEERRWKETA